MTAPTTDTKKHPFAALIGTSGTLHFAGIDQGIDFTGAGPVYALGPGQITRVEKGGTGWPGQGALVVEQLTGGLGKGRSVYYAEDLSPAAGIAVGKVVAQGDVLALASGSGQAPGIEVGWAQSSGIPLAPRPAARPAAQFTPEGQSFFEFANAGSLGITPSGATTPSPAHVSTYTPNAVGTVVGGAASAVAAPFFAGKQAVDTGVSLFKDAGSFFAWIGNTKNLVRVGEMVAGAGLIAIGVVMVGRAATGSSPAKQATGAAETVAAPAAAVGRRTVARRAPRRNAPISRQPRAVQKRAGFTLPVDRKPARGRPGSSRLAKGDTIPY